MNGTSKTSEQEADLYGDIPDLRGDIRHLVPKTGLREYWYPGIRAQDVKRKRPTKVRMLGRDIAFFRGKDGRIAALDDVCPHRGARLSEGHCHFSGTVSCPYHGWTFDENGKHVAVLSEGPDSRICGKPGTEARKYPTRIVRDIVFIWMGDKEPAPIEEDVPEEFFRADVHMHSGTKIWNANWEVALENALDSHVSYLHMNAWRQVLRGSFLPLGGVGLVPVWVGNGFAGGAKQSPPEPSYYYPELNASWPRTNYRRFLGRFFGRLLNYATRRKERLSSKWVGGHHLPGMLRVVESSLYATRWCVPVDEKRTRTWYFYAWPVTGIRDRLVLTLQHKLYMQWLHESQFSMQDYSVMPNQQWDTPEMLSPHDVELIHWRRLLVTKHLGGRDAKIRFTGRSLVGNEGLAGEDEARGPAAGAPVEAAAI